MDDFVQMGGFDHPPTLSLIIRRSHFSPNNIPNVLLEPNLPWEDTKTGETKYRCKGYIYIHSQSLKSKFEQKISQACCLFVRFYELEKGPKAVYRRLERYNYSVS